MNNPSVDILILTFARTKNLEEAIFSALNQDYDNYKITVLNACDRQKLYIKNDKVNIINISGNELSIGTCKNILIENSDAEFLTILDDDDILFPWHIKEHTKNIIDNNVDVSLSMECLFWERQINKITNRAPFTANLAFKNKNYIRYTNEKRDDFDQHFRALIKTISYKELLIDNPSYIYCWCNGVHHISGNPTDTSGFQNNAIYRLNNNLEPIGDIEIIPQLAEDAKILLKV